MIIKKQQNVNDCGLVVLQAIHKSIFGKWLNIDSLRNEAKMHGKGMNIASFINLGKKIGIECDSFTGQFKHLVKAKPKDYLVAMVQNKQENHFVIIKVLNSKIKVYDPIKGKKLYSFKEFEEIFTGIIISYKESDYQPKSEKFSSVWNLLFKNYHLISYLSLLIVSTIILTFVSTIYIKVVLDYIIPSQLKSTLITISIIFVCVMILRVFASFLKNYFLKKLNNLVEWELTNLYLNGIKEGEIASLNKLNNSDHLRRISLLNSSSQFISSFAFMILSEGISAMISAFILVSININLFIISAIASSLIILITLVFNFAIKNNYESTVNAQLEYLSSNINQIMSRDEMKETWVRKNYSKTQHRSFFDFKKKEFKIWWFETWQSMLVMCLINITPIILIVLSVDLIFKKEMTIGSMLMFINLFKAFISPLSSLSRLITSWPISMKNLKLMSYVINVKKEEKHEKGVRVQKIKHIKIKDSDIGYDRTLFHIRDWEIRNNIHLKGENGSGKTTLLKMLAARENYKNRIMFNNLSIDNHNLDHLRSLIFYASPKTYLPDMTIYEYITLGEPSAIDSFNQNLIEFKLYELLSSLNLHLEQKISSNGSNLSSGQRQLIILMRLFAFRYDLIILDEALENIDDDKVALISDALNRVQVGLIVEVSHSDKYLSKGEEVSIEEISKK